MKSVSVIIPVYNEAKTIISVLDKVSSVALDGASILEIIVVDDASTDETGSLLQNQKDPKVHYIRKEKNGGKGSAMRLGFTKASGDIILIQDADLEYSPDDYQKLLNPILSGNAQVVYGSRFLEKRNWGKKMIIWRAANYFLTSFSNLATGLRLTDMETCYKIFDRNVLDTFKDRLESNRFEIEVELTAWVGRSKVKIVEVPISYQSRSYAHGKKIGWRDGLEALGAIMRFRK